MDTIERIIAQYGLNELDAKRLRARREAARLHMNNERLPDYAQNHWAVVISLCDERLAKEIAR